MNRFIDITACLFQPPGWNPQADEIVFRSTERLEFSIGDIDEYGKVSDKIGDYRGKKIQTMKKENDEGFKFDDADTNRASKKETNTLVGPVQSKIPFIRKIEKEQVSVSKNTSMGTPKPPRQNPAIGLPYILVNQPNIEDEKFTLIYFHANSEDIFRSLKLCRVLAEFFRVVFRYKAKIIIPEYRGYSQLKSFDSDMDMIKTDMRFFVKELSKRGIIDIEKTILFVKGFDSGPKLGFPPGQLSIIEVQLPFIHFVLWFPKRGQDCGEENGHIPGQDDKAEVR